MRSISTGLMSITLPAHLPVFFGGLYAWLGTELCFAARHTNPLRRQAIVQAREVTKATPNQQGDCASVPELYVVCQQGSIAQRVPCRQQDAVTGDCQAALELVTGFPFELSQICSICLQKKGFHLKVWLLVSGTPQLWKCCCKDDWRSFIRSFVSGMKLLQQASLGPV